MFGHHKNFDPVWLQTFPFWMGLKIDIKYPRYCKIAYNVSYEFVLQLSYLLLPIGSFAKLERVHVHLCMKILYMLQSSFH